MCRCGIRLYSEPRYLGPCVLAFVVSVSAVAAADPDLPALLIPGLWLAVLVGRLRDGQAVVQAPNC